MKYSTDKATHMLVYKNGFVEFEYHIEDNTFILDRIIRTSNDEEKEDNEAEDEFFGLEE